MKNFFLLAILLLAFISNAYSQNWLWTKGGGGTSYDEAYAISTDGAGNVFVTGFFRSSTITFGTTTLTNADPSGNTNDLFIVKYDANGNTIWAKSTGGAGSDYAYSASVDAGGNLYVTGAFGSPTITFGSTILTNAGNGNIFIAKYDASGNVLWAKSIAGAGDDYGHSVSTDANGNLFITGMFASSTLTFGSITLINSGGFNAFIAKYDANGNLLWAKRAGGTGYDYGNSVSADIGGNVFMTGQFESPSITFGATSLTNITPGTDDLFIAKYDANGNLLWAKRAGGTSYDGGSSLSADAVGNVFVTGYFYSSTITFGSITLTNIDPSGYTKQVFIARYDANGNVLWAKSAGGTAGTEAGYSVSADENGNAFITGYFDSPTIIFDTIIVTPPAANCNMGCDPLFIVKYDANGNALCASALSSGGFNNPVVCADRFGNAYIGGEFKANPFIVGTDTLQLTGVGNIFVVKYNCGGDVSTLTNEVSNEESISVYPNPCSGIFTVNLKNKTDGTKICVYDVLGKCIYDKVSMKNNNKKIDLGSQPKGVYFMEIQSPNERVIKKIVLQ